MTVSDQAKQNEKDNLSVKETLAGNTDAFRAIVTAYETRLRSFCRMRLPDSEIDDAMQEIFIKTFRNLKSFHAGYNFASWFFAIAFNTIAGKKSKFKKELDKKNKLIAFAESLPSENEGQKNLEAEMIRDFVNRLKDGNRKVVELYYFAELDVEQIGKTLGIGESSVKTRLFRARKELRKFIEESNQ